MSHLEGDGFAGPAALVAKPPPSDIRIQLPQLIKKQSTVPAKREDVDHKVEDEQHGTKHPSVRVSAPIAGEVQRYMAA